MNNATSSRYCLPSSSLGFSNVRSLHRLTICLVPCPFSALYTSCRLLSLFTNINALSCVHNSWWPYIPGAGFSNSNDHLDPSEYGSIWSPLNDPLSENGFQQLPEIPQAAGGENFQDFSAGVIQGLEGYGPGLEVFNQQSSTPSAKGKKAFPQTPTTVLHSTDLPSLAFVVAGHPGIYFNPPAPAPAHAPAPTHVLAPRSRKGCWYASSSSFLLGVLTIFCIF